MRYLSRLLDLEPGSTKAAVLKRLKLGKDETASPIVVSLPGDKDTSYKLVVEFDRHEQLAFGELTASIKGEDKALSEFRRLGAELHRTGVIEPCNTFLPPIRRTTLAMTHLLAWSTWPISEGRRLQLLVGIFHSAHAQSHRTQLAASVHFGADRPDYGPKPGDISTAQAKGWDDYHRFARPDVSGGLVLLKDALSTVPIKVEPEPYGPGSVFRIFQ